MTREEAIKIVKEFINGTCLHLVDQEALETLIPELRESEDEKTRKWIVDLIKEVRDDEDWCVKQENCERAIAYLEKQKEQKPIKVIYIPKFRSGDTIVSTKNQHLTYIIRKTGVMDESGELCYECEILADGKSDNDIKLLSIEKVDSWGELVKQKEQKANTERDICDTCDWNSSCITPCPAKLIGKEQKPAENSTRAKIISKAKSEKQAILITESDGNAEISWDTRSLKDTKLLLEHGLEYINKQLGIKPAEWSEEDVKRLYSIGTQIGFLKGKYSECQKDIDWLDALAEKMGFHKCKIEEIVTEWKKEDIDDKMLSKSKLEWSKEDEETLSDIIDRLDTDNRIGLDEFSRMEKLLKSLRPQPK